MMQICVNLFFASFAWNVIAIEKDFHSLQQERLLLQLDNQLSTLVYVGQISNDNYAIVCRNSCHSF